MKIGAPAEKAAGEATRSEINFFGPGTNELAKADEFRDDGVFQVRLLDLDDSSGDIGRRVAI